MPVDVEFSPPHSFDNSALARAEEVAAAVVDAAIYVHARLGPGLLESTYAKCLGHVLTLRGFNVATEVAVPIDFDGLHVGVAFRIDMLIDNLVVLELKSVDTIHKVHIQQLRTYLKLAEKPIGFVLNFNEGRMSWGTKRVTHHSYEPGAMV